jgi:hypothetical protein
MIPIQFLSWEYVLHETIEKNTIPRIIDIREKQAIASADIVLGDTRKWNMGYDIISFVIALIECSAPLFLIFLLFFSAFNCRWRCRL